MKHAKLTIKTFDLSKLIPHPKNPRIHPEPGTPEWDALKRSLEADYFDPVIVNLGKTVPTLANVLVSGHLRTKVLAEMGVQKVDAVVVDYDETKHLARMLAANNQTGTWDDQTLADLLAGLPEEAQAEAGFPADELARLMAVAESNGEAGDKDAEPQINRAAELNKVWKVRPGDLWAIGDHRLLCGDSTKREDVERVMGGERAGLMNTDPPYGIGYANADRPNPGAAKPRVAKPRVANDDLLDKKLQLFLEKAFNAAVGCALKKDAAWYLWHAHLTQGYFAAAAAAADVILHRQIIWVKPVLLLGRGQYHWKHEPCFMGWVKGNQPPDYGEGNGERTQTTIWEVGSITNAERREFDHSTPKPVGLFTLPLVKHLKAGEVCYDPFSGSGPQVVAAQNTGRRCMAIEISPDYCAVILKRMQDAFGLTGERITP